ncbi:hypothetical protein GCM10010310_30420 [Streptomyces violaceolatus]|uniref:Uncharacterized protein n=1 Tax=Streptomyces violaceolatus TaxID=67378 RepID=A0ABN3SNH0_9ACTN|nr:hypothetical protein GCM10010391_32680 [Streptomyces anthocyanicus]
METLRGPFCVGVRPLQHRQSRQADARGDYFVRFFHPGRRPHELAAQSNEARSDPGVESGQQRALINGRRGSGSDLLLTSRRPERDQWAVHVEEEERALR